MSASQKAMEAEIASLMSQVSLLTESMNSTSSSVFDTGDTAWMLTSTALVLFMTMPGLCLYYAGMLSEKGVLYNTFIIFSICCLVTVEWFMFGYSIAFAPATTGDTTSLPYYGDGTRLWLLGMEVDSVHMNAPTIPESVYCAYQLTFAIITPALMCGSFADRMKYECMVLFMAMWHVIVYCPLAHIYWHPDGFLYAFGTLDFAGGNVVHISSGIAGLMSAIVLGNRKGWTPKDYETHKPHNVLLTVMGMSMIWVGWIGFNAGSAVAANARASYALLATQIATATAALSWLATETIFRKKTSVLGMCGGAIAGLVCITPAAGYVDMTGAFFIGLFGGVLCYFGAQLKHHVLNIDDALDAFGVHAIGGIVGGIGTGFFSTDKVTGNKLLNGVYYAGLHVGGMQLARQICGILFALAWSGIVSYVLLKVLDLTLGLRVSASEENDLDQSKHGETIIPKLQLDDQSKHNPLVENTQNGQNNVDNVQGAQNKIPSPWEPPANHSNSEIKQEEAV